LPKPGKHGLRSKGIKDLLEVDDISALGELSVLFRLARCLDTTRSATHLAFPGGVGAEVNEDWEFKVVTLFGLKVTLDLNGILASAIGADPLDLVAGFALNGALQRAGVAAKRSFEGTTDEADFHDLASP